MRIRKLNDLYPNPVQNGIFYAMSRNTDLKVLFGKLGIADDIDFHSIDLDYIYNHSGEKTLSVLATKYIEQFVFAEGFVVDPAGNRVTFYDAINSISNVMVLFVIKTRFFNKWEKLIDTLNEDYDFLSPYQMNVEESGNNISEHTIDESTSNNGKIISEDSSTNENTNKSSNYGYDSDTPSPADESEGTNNSSSSGTTTNTNTRTNTKTEDNKEMSSRTIKRSGNIGNKTAQELINEQRELLKYQILDSIYEDLDSVLTRSCYAME